MGKQLLSNTVARRRHKKAVVLAADGMAVHRALCRMGKGTVCLFRAK